MAQGLPESGSTEMRSTCSKFSSYASPNHIPRGMSTHGCEGSNRSDCALSLDERDDTFSFVTYNCEGLMSALPVVGDLLLFHGIVFISETWMSRSEEQCLPCYINESCAFECMVMQEFAMKCPPAAGAGRRHGDVV